MRWPLGIVSLAYRDLDVRAAARLAREQGFDHIDVPWDAPGNLALAVGQRFCPAWPPRPGCGVPALARSAGAFDETVTKLRAVPGALLEPLPGSCAGSIEACRALVEAVPGLRLVVDTGHVACWGEDPVELLPLAGHVQLRQARRGVDQALEGDVDFARVFARLEALDYGGLLSVEYFDLPDWGAPLDDPLGFALALAAELRPLLR